MIDEIYINESMRIRQEFLENLLYITKEEESVNSLISDLDTIKEKVENSEGESEQYYRDSLFEINLMIKKASEKITPFYDKKTKLDKEQRNLYNSIKDKYPNITDEDMANELIPHIHEVDMKFKKKHGNILK